MNLPTFLKRPSVGVDLGSRTIKGVKLKCRNGQVCLDRYFFHDLATTSSEFPANPSTAETLKAKVETSRILNSKAAVNIRDEDVFNFNFSLPKMKDSEMVYAAAHEIQDSINIPIEELSFDYIVQDSPAAKPGDNLKVKAYCAKRDAVVARVNMLKAAQLKPVAVESDVLALLAMLQFNDYLEPEKHYAVFDMGESHTTTALISGRELTFSKSAKIGCGRINQALKETLGMGYLQGEDLKLKHDFNQAASQDTASGKVIDQAYLEIFRDVKETLELFKEQLAQSGRIDRILLVGGGSRIKDVERVFEFFFKIPTTVVNPFKNIQIYDNAGANTHSADEELEVAAPYMATAVGLALREIA